jgi:osmotically-inducible protein OsmY
MRATVGQRGPFIARQQPETAMNAEDEKIRDAITDALMQHGIDARSLAVEVRDGAVSIRGSVPTQRQRDELVPTAAAVAPGRVTLQIAVTVAPAAPSGNGTSADSAHENRHQREP